MQFERDTLTQVVEARGKAISAPDQASRVAAENQLTAGLGRLLAVIGELAAAQVRSKRDATARAIDYDRKSDCVLAPGLQ